jgi:hypothetical protein
MANWHIPTAGNLAVRAIWYVFFSNIMILHQCGLYCAAGYLQEITVGLFHKHQGILFIFNWQSRVERWKHTFRIEHGLSVHNYYIFLSTGRTVAFRFVNIFSRKARVL